MCSSVFFVFPFRHLPRSTCARALSFARSSAAKDRNCVSIVFVYTFRVNLACKESQRSNSWWGYSTLDHDGWFTLLLVPKVTTGIHSSSDLSWHENITFYIIGTNQPTPNNFTRLRRRYWGRSGLHAFLSLLINFNNAVATDNDRFGIKSN